MAAFTLIRGSSGAIIPGGIQFNDPVTGKKYLDTVTRLDGRAREVLRDRTANQRLITDAHQLDLAHILMEVSTQNCTRLKNDPRHCSNGTVPIAQPPPLAPVAVKGKICMFCRSDQMEAVYCQTCSGSKITHFHCKSCGKDSRR